MSTKSLNNETVLNFIKENIDNQSFISKIKDVLKLNDNNHSFSIPEWHKEHVREVIKNTKEEEYVLEEDFFNLIK